MSDARTEAALDAHSAHVVQFYESDEFLCDVVAGFAEDGLRLDEAVILIATEPHRQAVERQLLARGRDTRRAVASGQLILLDAAQTIAAFLVDGMPDRNRMASVIGSVVAKAAADGRRVRGYGEMVDLLWREGNHRAALALEEAWNGVAHTEMAGLLCGYSMDNFVKESHADGFGLVCAAHSSVRPTEGFRQAEGVGRGMHEIARLQQRARALESEVTHRRALEVDLRQALAREQLALRAKDEFVAMLGHELRNPLGVIALSIQLMSQRLGDEALEERRAIERQAKMLGRLVDDLLEGARVSQGKIELRKEQLELSRIVARALEIASPLIARKHQALHVSVPSEGLGIEGDCERLTQAVANLLTNAAKYTGEGGTIRVTGGAADGRVILRVADDGVGIAPELLLRIFEPFVQGDQSLDRSEGGLGLGLAVAKRLVELHGGTIVARSDGPGRGSELTVSLTQIACPPYDRSATGWAPEAPEQRLKVMVVDDNVDLAAAVGAAVQQLGHEVSVIHRAGAALAALSTRPPDVALVDIGLPEMDGYELARRVRARATGPRVFLVAVTGYGDASYRARSLDAGFDAHVVKPLDLPALQALLGGVPCAPRA